MTESKEEIVKCSQCKCMKMISLFNTNANTGLRQKTCNQCRTKFKCDKCEYSSCNKDKLQRHIKQVHEQIKDHKCDKCEYACSTIDDLKRHIKQVHDKIKDHKCDKCEYSCSANSTLKDHINQVHLKIKDIKCDKCNFSTFNNTQLQRHIKAVHDKIKDIKCDKCDFSSSNNTHLQRHIKAVHLKIKNYKCQNCEIACSENHTLQEHIKICKGEFNGSYAEKACMDTLNLLELKYEYDSVDTEFYEQYSKKLRFDFIVNMPDGQKKYIELNGQQHYIPKTFGGMSQEQAVLSYAKQIKHDALKSEFCKLNNKEFLVIGYTEFSKIDELVRSFLL
jgi:hypothetical protein